jgi:hypothetical protein
MGKKTNVGSRELGVGSCRGGFMGLISILKDKFRTKPACTGVGSWELGRNYHPSVLCLDSLFASGNPTGANRCLLASAFF